MMTPKHTLAFAATLLTAGVASAQSFTEVPGGFTCTDITPDAKFVCGSGGSGGYYWDWKVDAMPTFIGGNGAVAISDDGMYLAGSITDPTHGTDVAARYSVATGMWESCGFLPSANPGCGLTTAYDISGDGKRIVGLAWDNCDAVGFLWEEGIGITSLEVLVNGGNRASTISGTGDVVGGFAQGNCRTPAEWDANTLLGIAYDDTSCGEVYGVSEDGSRTCGYYNGESFYKVGASPLTTVGTLIPGYTGNPSDITDTGSRMVGFDFQLLDRIAWVWEPATGFTNLYLAMDAAGVPGLPPFGLSGVLACSADGETMVGWTQFGGCWVVEWPICDGGFSNVCQTAGNSVDAAGALMGATGSVTISANDLVLTSSPVPNQNGLHYFGSNLIGGGSGVPFGNGWRCVGPSPVFRLPISQASGNVLTTAVDYNTAPATMITAGSTWYFQGWYRDPAAGGDQFNLSDAMEITFCD